MNPRAAIGRLVEASARRRGLVLALWAVAALAAVAALPRLRLDALPDLGEPQVVVATPWMGKAPRAVDEQVTYPIVTRLQSLPGVRTVRGQSMTGMSFVNVIFHAGADADAARGRVLEQVGALGSALPAGAVPSLGPGGAGVGWIFQYALRPAAGSDVAPLRVYQDTVLRHALAAVPGVAEVATVGGGQRQYEIAVDLDRLRARDVTLSDLARALRAASADADEGPLEIGGRELQVTVRAPGDSAAALAAVTVRGGEAPVRVGDVATVAAAPVPTRGVAELDGGGDVVGGIVIMRDGENAPRVLTAIKRALRETTAATLPAGAEVVVTYDRSDLVDRAVATLGRALIEETAAVVLLVLAFLLHARSAALPALSVPLTVLVTLGVLAVAGVPATIMSLGGIAIALGATVDAEIVMLEACHRRLEQGGPGGTNRPALAEAGRAVTPAIVCSLLIIAVGFLPVFALDGQAGRLFAPLALAKTTVMVVSALLSVTLAPALRDLALAGGVRAEARNPLARFVVAVYRPFVFMALRNPRWTLATGALALLSVVPLLGTLGEEFMPVLDEGDLLYMPATPAAIGPEEARRALQAQDRALHAVPEVATVFGKAGRAETASDPAPLTMIETTVRLKPRGEWRRHARPRWFSAWAPPSLRAFLSRLWPEDDPWSRAEVIAALEAAVAMPGWTGAFTMPIRGRIDMQGTGVRTAAGLKITGPDLDAIERTGQALAGLLPSLLGTKSAVYEPIFAGRALDVVPDLDALARHGVDLGDLQATIAVASGGLPVAAPAKDRRRAGIVLRLPAAARASVDALGAIAIATVARPVGGARVAAAAPVSAVTGDHDSGVGVAAAVAAPRIADAPARPGFVRLRDVAALRELPAPAMVRDEDGLLTGYLYIDVDESARDLAGYVADGAAALGRWQATGALALPPGVRLRWTGAYEALAATRARLTVVVPLALLVIALLLFGLFRSVAETLIVLLSIPFALVGSVWALSLAHYRLSAPVWIGLVAVVGLAAQTGVVMIIYMDQAFERRRAAGLLRGPADVVAAVLEGTVARVRPKLMTVLAMIAGLLPLLWADTAGADVMKRIAAPMVGGLCSSTFLTLELIPVVYTFWRQRQLRGETISPPWAWRTRAVPASVGRSGRGRLRSSESRR